MLEADDDRPHASYGVYLVWYLRGVALLWLVKGLMHWSLVLGWGEGAQTRFLGMSYETQAATVFFAVLDLIAAVGLWMAAAWGGVIWLLAAMAHLLLVLFVPSVFGPQPAFLAVIVALIAIYLFLTYMASRPQAED